jgi:hypothetical protein
MASSIDAGWTYLEGRCWSSAEAQRCLHTANADLSGAGQATTVDADQRDVKA